MSDTIFWAEKPVTLDEYFHLRGKDGNIIARSGDLKILAGFHSGHRDLVALQIRPFISMEGGGYNGKYIDLDLTNPNRVALLTLPLPDDSTIEFTATVLYFYKEGHYVLMIKLAGDNISHETCVFRVNINVCEEAKQASAA